MDYEALYERFIEDRRGREDTLTIFDVHHIHPRCLGGSNETSNLIKLSPGDHLFAHLLLARIFGGKLVVSFLRMSGMKKYRGSKGRRQYSFLQQLRRDQLRKFWSDDVNKERQREVLNRLWSGPLRSEEQTARRRKQMLGNQHGKNPTPETSRKLSAASGKHWEKPGSRQEQSRRSTEMWSDEARRERHKTRIAALWADPSSAYNQAAYRKKLGQRRPK